MKWLTDKTLDRVRAGDLDTLESLDDRGLLIGPGETPEAFAERLATLAKNIEEFLTELREHETVDLFGTPLQSGDAIPAPVWRDAQKITRDLYGFSVDWVPGFFTDHRMGLLFAGCAYYSFEDFFAVFVIRNSFRHRAKWLIYSRTELIAHELCHIAHIGFRTWNFEEMFAYQTAEIGFRRVLGGLLRSTTDTYLLLGSVLALLAAQLLNISLRPPELWNTMPMPLAWLGAGAAVSFVALRYAYYLRRFRRARAALELVYGRRALPVLFRCDEPEITSLAAMPDRDAVLAFIAARATDLRWRIIARKFST